MPSPPCLPRLGCLKHVTTVFLLPTNLRLLAVRCRIVLVSTFHSQPSCKVVHARPPQFAQICKRLDRRLLRHGGPFFWKRSLCLASSLHPFLPILEMLSCPALSLSLSLQPSLSSSAAPPLPPISGPLYGQWAALICPKCPEGPCPRNMRLYGRGW